MKGILTALLLTLAASATATATATTTAQPVSLPADGAPAPAQRAVQPESGSDLPIPPGWHVREETHADKVALFVTKEDIETSGGFLTGFSLNHFPDFYASKKIRPSEYAAMFAQHTATGTPNASSSQAEIAPGVVVHEVRALDSSRKPDTILLYLIAGDDARDALSLAWYESPEPVWDTEWVHGEAIVMDHLRGIARASNP